MDCPHEVKHRIRLLLKALPNKSDAELAELARADEAAVAVLRAEAAAAEQEIQDWLAEEEEAIPHEVEHRIRLLLKALPNKSNAELAELAMVDEAAVAKLRAEAAAAEQAIQEWLAIRKEAGRHIDPETAEVLWHYVQVMDPYGVDPDLPDEYHCVGRGYFARSPGSDVWVDFGDLPVSIRDALWEKHKSQLAFAAGLEDLFQRHET